MVETIGRYVNVSVADSNLCVFGVPYILVGREPQGNMLSKRLKYLKE